MFVHDGDSRQKTAALLVGTAEEFGIPQRDVRATTGGFNISDALVEVLQADGVLSDEGMILARKSSKKTSTKKTSGNRAAKNTETPKE